jgi:DNA-binding NtrC family response regulator
MHESRILVVDDEPVVTKSCRRILAEKGYQVDTVESGQEGLQRALDEHFDLVMTDLKMPDLDGMELVRTLRKERPETAIVIITGYGSIPSAIEATKLGVFDYIQKPFTPDEISSVVSRVCPPVEEGSETYVQAEEVKEVLRLASRDAQFGKRLLFEGKQVLYGFPLSPEAKMAIVSGDIAWIEKRCGNLTLEERMWLQRRAALWTTMRK